MQNAEGQNQNFERVGHDPKKDIEDDIKRKMHLRKESKRWASVAILAGYFGVCVLLLPVDTNAQLEIAPIVETKTYDGICYTCLDKEGLQEFKERVTSDSYAKYLSCKELL